eukprot:2178824-Pleurochrysis_carterae.AAC.1
MGCPAHDRVTRSGQSVRSACAPHRVAVFNYVRPARSRVARRVRPPASVQCSCYRVVSRLSARVLALARGCPRPPHAGAPARPSRGVRVSARVLARVRARRVVGREC